MIGSLNFAGSLSFENEIAGYLIVLSAALALVNILMVLVALE